MTFKFWNGKYAFCNFNVSKSNASLYLKGKKKEKSEREIQSEWRRANEKETRVVIQKLSVIAKDRRRPRALQNLLRGTYM